MVITRTGKTVTIRTATDEKEFAYGEMPPLKPRVFGFFVGMALMPTVERWFH
jgi:hypothetical protein